MKYLNLLSLLLVLIAVRSEGAPSPNPIPFMIRHSVVFKLKCAKGSAEEREFFRAAAKLSQIPGVHQFESLRQTSAKNDFDFGLSMEFDSRKDYEEYTRHPDHTQFVQTFWINLVEKYLEIDYEPIR